MIRNINIQDIITIAKQAGKIIMSYYASYDLNIHSKEDSSPVTCADLASNKLICEELNKLYPDIPIISEEDNLNRSHNGLFWSVDPLDATQSFIHKNGEFTINIGLVANSAPILGVIYSPLSKKLYYVEHDGIAYKQLAEQAPIPIQTREVPETGLTVLISALSSNPTKLNLYLANKKIDKIIPFSSALKICIIAEGAADIYPRFGKTMEWDTAAAHAILSAAGGSIRDLEGNCLTYGHQERKYYNPEFIASGTFISK